MSSRDFIHATWPPAHDLASNNFGQSLDLDPTTFKLGDKLDIKLEIKIRFRTSQRIFSLSTHSRFSIPKIIPKIPLVIINSTLHHHLTLYWGIIIFDHRAIKNISNLNFKILSFDFLPFWIIGMIYQDHSCIYLYFKPAW